MICDTGPDFAAARRAANWVSHFHPDVTVVMDRERAQLASPERSERALGLIWRSALANERLLADCADARERVIAALAR